MPNKTCYVCEGLVIPKGGREPPLTGHGVRSDGNHVTAVKPGFPG